MRKMTSRRIFSLVLTIAMVIGMIPAFTVAAAEPSNKIVVYRNLYEDYAGDSLELSLNLLTQFKVRDDVLKLWKDEIIEKATGYGYISSTDAAAATDIQFYVQSQNLGWLGFNDQLLTSKAGYFFGWNSVDNSYNDKTIEPGSEKEGKVRIVKKANAFSAAEVLSTEFEVYVQAFVTVQYVDANGTPISQETVTIGQAPANIPDMTGKTYKEGKITYGFTGWDNGISTSTALDVADATTLDGDGDGIITCTAEYENEIAYDVDFVDGQGVYATRTVNKRHFLTDIPADPEKDGSVFNGWFDESGAEVNFETLQINAPTSVYADWNTIANVYFFDGEDLLDALTQAVEEGKTATEPEESSVPAKDGYTFKGWYADPECTTAFDFSAPISANGASVYALYEINTFDVNYFDGTGIIGTTEDVPYGTTVEPIDAPEKPGHSFDGWYADPELTKEFNFQSPITDTTSIYAKYTANKYTITFKMTVEGEVPPFVTLFEKEYNYGETPEYEGETPTKENYTFAGWANDEDGSPLGPVTGDAVYFAQFTQKPVHTVTYLDEEGNEIATESVIDGNKPAYAVEPTKEATDQYRYEFLGWVASGNDEPLKVGDLPAVEGDITYGAIFTEIPLYTVIWQDEDGTELEKDTGMEEGDAPQYDGETPTKEADAQYTYTFAGWVANEGDTPIKEGFNPVGGANSDSTIYYTAVYNETVNKYKVDWYVDGELVSSDELEYGSAVEAPAGIDPEKESTAKYDYIFNGWLKNGEEEVESFDSVTEDVEYHASFVEALRSYGITFMNGSEEIGYNTFNYGETPVYEGETPVKEADDEWIYTFKGWDPELVPVTGEATYTAVFTQSEKPLIKTTIEADPDTITLTYGYSNADVMVAVDEIITVYDEDGNPIEDAKYKLSKDTKNLPAGEYEVQATYNGDDTYAPAEAPATFKIIVEKAEAIVNIDSQAIKYGAGFDNPNPITANTDIISFVAGIDAHDETNIVGEVQIELPTLLYGSARLLAGVKGIDLNDMTIDELKDVLLTAITYVPGVGGLLEKVNISMETINKLVDTLKAYAAKLPMETELSISVTNSLVLPTNVGAYLLGAVSANNNYTTDLAAGYLIITPNGIKVELDWIYDDANNIITLPALEHIDLGASVTLANSAEDDKIADLDEAKKHLEYLFVGVDKDGDLLFERDLPTDAKIGVYAEVAYIANWDNDMYYAMPIVRPLIIAPGVADVTFVDVNGNTNYAQAFTYDGTPKSMTALVNGEEGVEGLEVTYIGMDTRADGWYRTEAPTESGLYAVIALYTEYDQDGSLAVAGGCVGAMMIEQAEVGQFELSYTEVPYDGDEHFADLTMDKAYDTITIAIDRANNVAYVNLPDDLDEHMARLPESVQAKIAEIIAEIDDNDVYLSTIKSTITDVIDELIALDAVDKAEELFDKALARVKAEVTERIDIQALKDTLFAELENLKAAVKDKLPEEIETILEKYITANKDEISVDTDGLKAEILAQIERLKDVLPEEILAELEVMIDDMIASIKANAQVQDLKETAKKILAKLEAVKDASPEELAAAVIGAAAGLVDTDALKNVVDAVIEKVAEQDVIDEAIALIKDVASMYKGDLDTDALEAAVDALIEKVKGKIQSGKFDDDDLANLEIAVDEILAEIAGVINQLPDGRIVFGANPTEVGVYDCYAMNISANYKPTFTYEELVIYTELTLEANSGEYKYDGTEKTVEGYTVVEDTDYTITGLEAAAVGTNAGTYPVTFAGQAVVTDANGNDITRAVKITTIDGELVITKRSVILTSADDSKTYDKTPLTNDTVTVTGDGFVEGEGADFEVTGSQTEIGSSANEFGYTLWQNTLRENYDIAVMIGTLTVTKAGGIIIPILTNGHAILTKVDVADGSVTLKGAKFALYRENGDYVGTFTTDAEGKIYAWDLKYGNYYWVETGAPEGYTLDATPIPFSVEIGKTTVVTAANAKTPVPGVFGDDHYAYIIGYADGTVRPEAEITRAEVATIFFRLLADDVRDFYMTDENSFSDVSADAWYNRAISTMAAMGIINGDPEGTFRPDDPITRAEFAAIASRFEENGDTRSANFADCYNHWGEEEISIAYNNGWIMGYEDNTFKPDQLITRAEAMTVVNRVLQRIVKDASSLHADMATWTDNMDPQVWYYLAVQEATNSHNYYRNANNREVWTEIRPTRDWTELQK